MTAQIEAVDFFAFDNSYARLPDRFFARLRPTPVAEPHLVRLNKKLAWHLRLDPGKLAAPEGVEILAGNRVPKRGEPLAMAYAGHQFAKIASTRERDAFPKTLSRCTRLMLSSTEASTSQWESSVFVSPIKAPALIILEE